VGDVNIAGIGYSGARPHDELVVGDAMTNFNTPSDISCNVGVQYSDNVHCVLRSDRSVRCLNGDRCVPIAGGMDEIV
jgi:hypothetical protein